MVPRMESLLGLKNKRLSLENVNISQIIKKIIDKTVDAL